MTLNLRNFASAREKFKDRSSNFSRSTFVVLCKAEREWEGTWKARKEEKWANPMQYNKSILQKRFEAESDGREQLD